MTLLARMMIDDEADEDEAEKSFLKVLLAKRALKNPHSVDH